MPAKLFTHTAMSDAFDRGEALASKCRKGVHTLVGQASAVQSRSGQTLIAAHTWLAGTHAARVIGNIVERSRRAREYVGAGKRAKVLEVRTRSLEAENERLKSALEAYQRAAYLTLTQSDAIHDNRVRVDGKWHEVECPLPWYRTSINELDVVYACVHKLMGEQQFAAALTGRGRQALASAAKRRAGTSHLRIAA